MLTTSPQVATTPPRPHAPLLRYSTATSPSRLAPRGPSSPLLAQPTTRPATHRASAWGSGNTRPRSTAAAPAALGGRAGTGALYSSRAWAEEEEEDREEEEREEEEERGEVVGWPAQRTLSAAATMCGSDLQRARRLGG